MISGDKKSPTSPTSKGNSLGLRLGRLRLLGFAHGALQLLAENTSICSFPDTRPFDRPHHPISCNENGHRPIIPQNLREHHAKSQGNHETSRKQTWNIYLNKNHVTPP